MKPKMFTFNTIGEQSGLPSVSSPFREEVQIFLKEGAESVDYQVRGMHIWRSLVVHENQSLDVPLYTIEETVQNSTACTHCQRTGWSNHYIAKKNYHFLIPIDSGWNKPLDESIFVDRSHLLYGIIHCDGFGHLLCINGIEGGSKHLFGREIMNLWDQICTNLQARKISVVDATKKRSMELRLLHGVAYKQPWFGRWHYGFCRGSFGVTGLNYEMALKDIGSLELDRIIRDFSGTEQAKEIKEKIHLYRDLCETQLITIHDLLKFMLTVRSRLIRKPIMAASMNPSSSSSVSLISEPSTKPAEYKKLSTVIANSNNRWTEKRVKQTADEIVSALKKKKERSSGDGGIGRLVIRDAVKLKIGDTGLIDYVLKSLDNVVVRNQIIRRAVNPATKIYEYTIHEVGDKVSEEQDMISNIPSPAMIAPGVDVYNDVIFLYKQVLMEYPDSKDSKLVESATQRILDTKHFVKAWPLSAGKDQIICRLLPDSLGDRFAQIVDVPLNTTLSDLKDAVARALRETYCAMEGIKVDEFDGLEGMGNTEVLFGRVELGTEIGVRVVRGGPSVAPMDLR
ncbi:hypothetical protein TIFTF001_039223 [Ficus carica]|uniref:Uncharacterized protein n=1 Tax=Ficus carica TaxID=3494 RepID=A0AA88A290_FICCA|nr:hypothetical protein TIFTF001_044740 [Ficus carica]GMN32961.1 hypothetical protein TIFTF001_044742 [Ficus carica]GMN70179.1 hypothetical protein TIFTF001_039223 [Ficus carica]